MDEKNYEKLLSFFPNILLKTILNLKENDNSIFSNESNNNLQNINIFPLKKTFKNTIILKIKIHGLISLSSLLKISDTKRQKDKIQSEFLSNIISKLLNQISKIINKKGGEIINFSDNIITIIYDISEANEKIEKYIYYYSQLVICSIYEIYQKINLEILNGIKLDLSFGISIGEFNIIFFDRNNKNCNFLFFGNVIDNVNECINFTNENEIIISKSFNDILNKLNLTHSYTLYSKGNKNLFQIDEFEEEEELYNFSNFQNLKKFSININFDKEILDKLSSKIQFIQSLIPKKILDYNKINYDNFISEIYQITIMTLTLIIEKEIINNEIKLQSLIIIIQKSIFLLSGIIFSINKIKEGLQIKIIFGLEKSTLNDTSNSISSSFIIINSIKSNFDNKIKIGIGITSGNCYIGLLNKKDFNIIGSKVFLSKQLSEEAIDNLNENKLEYIIYIDKKTMKFSQKFYRSIFIGEFIIKENLTKNEESENITLLEKIYFPIENEEIFIPSFQDPFPFIRTHKKNSFFNKNKELLKNEYKNLNNNNLSITQISDIENEEISYINLKLKKSLIIFGNCNEIKRMNNILNDVYRKKEKQFIFIKGFLGVGKSLFLRKSLNNFIGLNNDLGKIYFLNHPFLFCSILNPINKLIPFNGFNLIFRQIFLYIIKNGKIKKIEDMCYKNGIKNEDIKEINYILSLGKNDINLNKYFKTKIEKNEKNILIDFYKDKKKFENFNSINLFFFNMIIIYRKILNKKINEINQNLIPPLIFIIEDLQEIDEYSIKFLNYLYKKELKILLPLIIIMTYQIPLYNINSNNNLLNSKYDFFKDLNYSSNESIPQNLICFHIKPISDKKELEKLLIFSSRDLILRKFNTNLERIDDKILEFILQKSFYGIPLFSIYLINHLLFNNKYIQILSGEFIITNELLDNNEIFDWIDLKIPFIYEKLCSEVIDNCSIEKNILFKFSSLIGNFFNIKLLYFIIPFKEIFSLDFIFDKIKFFQNCNILEIYNENNLIENIICQFNFPFLRECLFQRIPIQIRSYFNIIIIKFFPYRVKFFSDEIDRKLFVNYLNRSDLNINNEIEFNENKLNDEIMNPKDILNTIILKIQIIKHILKNIIKDEKKNIFFENIIDIKEHDRWNEVNIKIYKEYLEISDLNYKKKYNLKIFFQNIMLSKIINNYEKYKRHNIVKIKYLEEYNEEENMKMLYLSSEEENETIKLLIYIDYFRVINNFEILITEKIKFINPNDELINNTNQKEKVKIKTTKSKNKISDISNLENNEFNELNNSFSSLKIIFNSSFPIFLGTTIKKISKIQNDSLSILTSNENSDIINDESDNKSYLLQLNIPNFLETSITNYMDKYNLKKKNSEEINLSIDNITDEIIPQENKLDISVLSFIGIETNTKNNNFSVSDNIKELLTKKNNKSNISNKKKKKKYFSSEKFPNNNINLPNSFISKINSKRSPSTIQVNEYTITDRDLTTLKNFVKQNKEYNEIFKYKEKKFDDYYYINEDNMETNVKIHKSNIFKKLKK